MSQRAHKIGVRGVVQGVGFRPFVYRLAREHGLTGWVLNHSGGVEIQVEGPPDRLAAFARDLREHAPPLARIEGIDVAEWPVTGYTTFDIRRSISEEGRYQLISPDIATCPDCLRELLDPADRRYRYPFTNCTNCGPRFTIIADIPYDRPLTTMRRFVMCPQCQAEYDDPLDRRFHAQPNACPECGPHVWLVSNSGERILDPNATDVIAQAAHLLQKGAILAIKGLGGFHLACDATNEAAVQTLKERKQRPAKPLAVMMATLDDVRAHCRISPEEEKLLRSPECPIVLLPWRAESNITRQVAPGNRYLGVMLPYTPLHHVLLRDVGRPLVMTSGNLAEEPIARDNDEALRRLGHLADYLVLHDRDIYARYDDSVWFVPHISPHLSESRITHYALRITSPQPIRRSRGYAPFPIKLPFPLKPVLACGAELKNTFCLTRDEYAFLSQHIGDMENLETLEHFETTIELYQRLFRIEPEMIAHDLHPDYLATRYARSHGADRIQVAVQHHHAHIASCLADNGWRPDDGPVIGVAWDGTGYGSDGHMWGGEFLVADYRGFRRAGQLEYLPMPGGEAAIRHPYRLAIGYLYALTAQLPASLFEANANESELRIIQQQVDQRINCPLTSAGGRLFDAVSALLGICRQVTFEGQAAIELEMAAASCASQAGRVAAYPFEVEQGAGVKVIRLRPLLEALLADWQVGKSAGEVAYRFHVTIAEMMRVMCEQIAQETGLQTVALSGGCFQNRLLLELVVPRLHSMGWRVLLHRQTPCNDGGISLGQAVVANFA